MPRRFDLGRAVLLAGAALLFVSLFLDWYDSGQSGWEVFETLDLVLAGLALAGAVAALRPEAMPPLVALAVPGLALVIVLVQLVNAPPAAGDAGLTTGAWLALGGSFLMAAGAALSSAAISVTVDVRERDLRRRVPAVDRRGEADAVSGADADDDRGGASSRGPGAGGRSPSLFAGLGFGDREERGDAEPGPGGAAAPSRTSAPTPDPASERRPGSPGSSRSSAPTKGSVRASEPASPPPAPAGADDLERTQPLPPTPEPGEGGAGRS